MQGQVIDLATARTARAPAAPDFLGDRWAALHGATVLPIPPIPRAPGPAAVVPLKPTR